MRAFYLERENSSVLDRCLRGRARERGRDWDNSVMFSFSSFTEDVANGIYYQEEIFLFWDECRRQLWHLKSPPKGESPSKLFGRIETKKSKISG